MIDVSVVIPAYNAAATIGETLASVRAQTIAPREVIVVDDGSTDDTGAIARAAGAAVHRQENRGLTAARNAGVALATSAWIAQLDADDLWAPEKLAASWSAVRAGPGCSVVFTDFWQFDEGGPINASVLHELPHRMEAVRREPLGERVWRCDRVTLADEVARHAVMMPSTLLIRKDLLDAAGGSDESIRGLGEDIELELRLLVDTDALFVDVPLMGYRRHAANLTANLSAQRASPLKVAERVAASPSRYLPSTVQWYRGEGARLRFIAGRMAAAEGDHENARRYLRQSLGDRARVDTLGWLALSYVADNALGRAALALGMKTWRGYRARAAAAQRGTHRRDAS